MKSSRKIQKVSMFLVFGGIGLFAAIADADRVLFSFNEDVVTVEAEGSVFNIPRQTFSAQFGEPTLGKFFTLGRDFDQFRVYDGGQSGGAIQEDQMKLTKSYIDYGGIVYEQYGAAFALLNVDGGIEVPQAYWTTVSSDSEVVTRELATTELSKNKGYLLGSDGETKMGDLIPTESEEVLVFDDGASLYWINNSKDAVQTLCASEANVLWKSHGHAK